MALKVATSQTGRLFLAVLLAGCGGTGGPSTPVGVNVAKDAGAAAAAGPVVGTVTGDGVEVRLRWSATSGAGPVIAATFTPLRRGFHLYSVDLPPGGVQGVGRPTRVEVGGGLAATGPPAVDRQPVPLWVGGLDTPVPVYPDGPVTLRLPTRRVPGEPVVAWVSYAACSRSSCLPPVTHRRVGLAVPDHP